MKPLLFLDFDSVICHGMPYGWPDVFSDARPVDLWERLWHPPAIAVLRTVVTEFEPSVVLTTSWLSLGGKSVFEEIFRSTGLTELMDALDSRQWQAPALRGDTRNDSIERWLRNHRQWLAPKVVLDDEVSGTGLRGSKLDRAGSVVWCERGVGLHAGHLPQIRRALTAEPVTGLAAAIARGLEAMRESTRNGTLVSADAFARARGISLSELASDESAGRVFALSVDSVQYYPAELLRFNPSAAAAISRALGRMNAASKFIFFMRRHGALGGLRASESATNGRLLRVIDLAQAWAREGGAGDGQEGDGAAET